MLPISAGNFKNGQLKIRCSAAIYDIYWQSTEISIEEDKTNIYNSSDNIVGINYHQPPPNFQLEEEKLNGEIDVKGKLLDNKYFISRGEVLLLRVSLQGRYRGRYRYSPGGSQSMLLRTAIKAFQTVISIFTNLVNNL